MKPSLPEENLCELFLLAIKITRRKYDINGNYNCSYGDVNSDVHSHFMTQIEGEFSPLNYGVTIFPVQLENIMYMSMGISWIDYENSKILYFLVINEK